MTEGFRLQTIRPGKDRQVKSDEELRQRLNDMISEGFELDKGTNGEIIEVVLPPNATVIVPHGLRTIPKYRLELRKTGNGLISDVDVAWTVATVGFKNESANELTVTYKLFKG